MNKRKIISLTTKIVLLALPALVLTAFYTHREAALSRIRISSNARYFTAGNGGAFFLAWRYGLAAVFQAEQGRSGDIPGKQAAEGFNVIQVMVLHGIADTNVYGDTATANNNVAMTKTTPGNSPTDATQYDYWDHVDFIVDKAAEKGIYMAMVPIWGGNVKAGLVNQQQAKTYATFLAQRYRSRPNIIWMNGGDIKGTDSMKVWNTIGNTLHQNDPDHIITFHPFGRMQSSTWFHDQPWLYFNMVQSGHRRYSQDTVDHHYGEDNWKYIQSDYARKPVKPVLDGEPSYEGIPQGLHDTSQPRWKAGDVRRYGYWSVFAGACGYTYGDNAVMQMRKTGEKGGAYGAKDFWFDAINDPGAGQMIYLKKLMLSRPYFERVPDQSIVSGKPGARYDYVLATRGKGYAFLYTYTGRNFSVNMGKITGAQVKASWYNPRDGNTTEAGTFANKGVHEFDPPGEPANGNDWVLVLDAV